MCRLYRRGMAVAILLAHAVFFVPVAEATHNSWKQHWSGSYKVKNYHYSYQYKYSKKYSSRQWATSSKYYCSGKKYNGYGKGKYYSPKKKYYKKKKHHSKKNKHYHKKCRSKGKYGYKGKYSKYCDKPSDLKPLAVDDEYFIKAGDQIDQNVVSENDTKGDGSHYAYIKYGKLPDGITLGRDGSLTGSTTEVGTFVAYYKLKDQDYDYSKAKITIHVAQDLKPVAENDSYSLNSGEVLEANIVAANDTLGDGSNTVTIVDGDLPDGFTLSSDGVLTGSSEDLGTFVISYELTDQDGDVSLATVTINVTKDVTYCPAAAESDDLHNGNSSHAIWIPQISSNLTFTEQPNATRTLPNGGLVVTGTIEDGDLLFDITMNFSGYSATSDDPKLELKNDAYVINGGPIDPSTWEFFENLEGTLVGTAGDWEGVTLSFSRRGPMGQLGEGASGKNGNFGFSSWFDAQIIETNQSELPAGFHIGQKLHGDINVDLPVECRVKRDLLSTQCSIAAQADSFANYSGGHSVVLFGLGQQKFAFEPAAEVRNFSNGDLEISGVAIDSNGQGFNVELVYTDSTSVGVPKLELMDAAYIDMAGPADPSQWSYFDGFTGVLTGLSGDYDGVEIVLSPRGPSAQIGEGADGKNVTFGLSNWLSAEVTKGSFIAGLAAGDTFNGDVNVDIKDDCTVIVDNPVDAIDDRYVLGFGESLGVNILANDILGDPTTTLSFNPSDIPAGFTLSEDGQLDGAFAFGAFEFSFDYTITDADGDTDTATVTVNGPGVGPSNINARNDTYRVSRDEFLNVNILTNDDLGTAPTQLIFDVEDIPFDFVLQSDGTLSGSSFEEGSQFRFNYTITDSAGETDTATVIIIITPDVAG